jgi:esterase
MVLRPNCPFKSTRLLREISRSFQSSSKSLGILQHEWLIEGKVVADGHPARNSSIQGTVIFLHGLLGNSKNLRNPAKRLTVHNPQLSALLLDIRGHGETARKSVDSSFHPPHSITACSADVLETLKYHRLTGQSYSPLGIIGHSLGMVWIHENSKNALIIILDPIFQIGGRVALQYLHDTIFSKPQFGNIHDTVHSPKHTWILDSVPGVAHGGVTKVIAAVAALNMPVASKKQLVESLLSMGIDQTIASWMTTNLKEASGGMYEFSFDLEIAKDILRDFSNHDLFHVLSECLSGTENQAQGMKNKVFMVQAGKNESWTPDVVKRMQDMEKLFSRFQRIVLPKAGHWVHVDDIDGLMSAVNSNFHQECLK